MKDVFQKIEEASRKLYMRKVRIYELFYIMQARINRASLKECVKEGKVTPPSLDAVWTTVDSPRTGHQFGVGWHILADKAYLMAHEVFEADPHKTIKVIQLTFTDAHTFDTSSYLVTREEDRNHLNIHTGVFAAGLGMTLVSLLIQITTHLGGIEGDPPALWRTIFTVVAALSFGWLWYDRAKEKR